MKKFATYFLAAILGGRMFAVAYEVIDRDDRNAGLQWPEDMPALQTGYVTPHPAVIGPDFVDAANVTLHAVVNIKAELEQPNKVYNDFFDLFNDFFGNPNYRY